MGVVWNQTCTVSEVCLYCVEILWAYEYPGSHQGFRQREQQVQRSWGRQVSDVFGEHKEDTVFQKDWGMGRVEGNEFREVTMCQKDLVLKVRSLFYFKYDRKPVVRDLTLFSAHFSSFTDLSMPENSKLSYLRAFAHAVHSTWNILTSLCVSGSSSNRFQFQHHLLKEALPDDLKITSSLFTHSFNKCLSTDYVPSPVLGTENTAMKNKQKIR